MHGLELGHLHPVFVSGVRELCHEDWLAMFEVVERVSCHDRCGVFSEPVRVFNALAIVFLSRGFYHEQAVLELVARRESQSLDSIGAWPRLLDCLVQHSLEQT